MLLTLPALYMPTEITAGYSGPGDVVASATAWWGLRGYNAAYSTGANPAIDVVDTATGLIQTTVNITAEGNLASATILGLGYAVSVKKIYDQTGNANHLAQATLSLMPSLTFTGPGSLPVMTFTALQNLTTTTFNGSAALTQALTISAVANDTGTATGTGGGIISAVNGASTAAGMYTNDGSANTVEVFAGSTKQVAASNNAWHAFIGIFSGASGNMSVDGADNSGAVGSRSLQKNVVMGAKETGTSGFVGMMAEVGIWHSAFNAGNLTNMSANAHTYWGF